MSIHFSVAFLFFVCALLFSVPSQAQVPPSSTDIDGYRGLHAAAHGNDVERVRTLLADGTDLEARDRAGRTPLHVAAFASNDEVVRLLAEAGADLDALEHQAYDIVTIAAVAGDLELLDLALRLGANPGSVTSPYDGTALIAAAHLGHYEVVGRLIEAGAPVDHVNNLGWTALIEAVVLGDGGANHVRTVKALLDGNADTSIADSSGATPLDLARARGYTAIVALLERR